MQGYHRKLFTLLLNLAPLVGMAPALYAQGILYPRPDVRIQPFYVKNLRVTTTITDVVAETTVEQTFVNDSPVEQEGTYLYPLPAGAPPASFSMTVGDRTLEPRILRKDEARSIYESIVRRRRDPVLLGYTEYTSFLVDEREQAALGLRTGTTARGMLSDGVQNIYGYEADNSIILRKEVARRATQNGVKGEAATNQSLRAKDLNQYDKVVSRYQTAQGGVSSVNGGVGGPPGMAVDTPVIGQLFKPAPGNFGGMDGFGGGGFGGRETQGGPQGEAADITVQAVGDRTFYRQKNNVWQDQSYLPKKQKLVQIQAFSDAHFALLKAAPQLAAYSSVGEEVIIRLGRNAVRIGKTGKERLSAAELKELTAR